jgi:hypothetical protein
MRYFGLLLIALSVTSEASAQQSSGPKSCSEAYGICASRCGSGVRVEQCRMNCSGYRDECLRTGTWQSSQYRAQGLARN